MNKWVTYVEPPNQGIELVSDNNIDEAISYSVLPGHPCRGGEGHIEEQLVRQEVEVSVKNRCQ